MRTNAILHSLLSGLLVAMGSLISGSCSVATDAPIGDGVALAPASPYAVAYTVEQVEVGATTEYRFNGDGHHFLTLIDEQGTMTLRPHPGRDVNGWGSSWYAQPFLPGAVLAHTRVHAVAAESDGIQVRASGSVARGPASTYGTWGAALSFTYDPGGMVVSGTGTYTISLDGPLSAATGDLNLYRIASNYLADVPLLSGGMGDTGDMSVAHVTGEGFAFTWVPPQAPAHFPTDGSTALSIDVVGEHNNVDTVAQGHARIEPAYKPGLRVDLAAQQPGVAMMFGGMYDLTHAQDFWEDNIGITPLVSQASDVTVFAFDVAFESRAIERCLYLPLHRHRFLVDEPAVGLADLGMRARHVERLARVQAWGGAGSLG